jgi:hypothetical protein
MQFLVLLRYFLIEMRSDCCVGQNDVIKATHLNDDGCDRAISGIVFAIQW